MGISIIVTRSIDKTLQKTNKKIELDEWRNLVANTVNLRLRQEPTVMTNPNTGEKIKMPPGPADSEIQIESMWFSFLGFRRGELLLRYQKRFENAADPFRVAIADVADRLDAVITHDAGDEILLW